MITTYTPPKTLDNLLPPEDTTDLNATTDAHGLLPKLDGDSGHFLDGLGSWNDPRVGVVLDTDFDENTILKADVDDTPIPVTIHEDTLFGRKFGGAMASQYPTDIRNLINVADGADVTASEQLDNLSAPDDNTDLNATTTTHGLMPKLDGTSTHFLNGAGNWLATEDYRPKNALFYYGWLNSFNSGTNGWNNELVAQEMAQYNMVIFGNGVQDPGHGDYANTIIIIPRIRALHPDIQIFGYVTLSETEADFETKAAQWDGLDVDGIFIDEAGYDFGNNRAKFNTAVDYIHALTSANIAFANSWEIDHVIGVVNDPAYPNSTWNPSLVASSLVATDWYLLESSPIGEGLYAGGDYQPYDEWKAKADKCISRRATFGLSLASVSTLSDSNVNGQTMYDFHFMAAVMCSLDAQGSSHLTYGSSSATTKMWLRPDVSNMGLTWVVSPDILALVGSADKFLRYLKFGKLYLDYNAFTTTITRYTA